MHRFAWYEWEFDHQFPSFGQMFPLNQPSKWPSGSLTKLKCIPNVHLNMGWMGLLFKMNGATTVDRRREAVKGSSYYSTRSPLMGPPVFSGVCEVINSHLFTVFLWSFLMLLTFSLFIYWQRFGSHWNIQNLDIKHSVTSNCSTED